MGLGYRSSDIQTKRVLRAHLINKGKPKYYYPDYLIEMRGIPLLVVEAKSPNEDLEKIPLIINAKEMVDYLQSYKEECFSLPGTYLKDNEYLSLFDFSEAIEVIEYDYIHDSIQCKFINSQDKQSILPSE